MNFIDREGKVGERDVVWLKASWGDVTPINEETKHRLG